MQGAAGNSYTAGLLLFCLPQIPLAPNLSRLVYHGLALSFSAYYRQYDSDGDKCASLSILPHIHIYTHAALVDAVAFVRLQGSAHFGNNLIDRQWLLLYHIVSLKRPKKL